MTTKVPVELSSTPGIVDGSNATAITIDSSERIGILQSSPTSNLHIGASGNDAKRELRIDGTNGSGQTFGFITEADGENGRVSFKVGSGNATPAQKLMIHPDGGICFNTDTAAANALDDYEEGSWTPVITSSGGSNNAALSVTDGLYTRIGRFIYISAFISGIDFTDLTDGTYVVITGLPFAASADNYAPILLSYNNTNIEGGYVEENGGVYLVNTSGVEFQQQNNDITPTSNARFMMGITLNLNV